MEKTTKSFSLADLDAAQAGSKAFEFEYLNEGTPTGIFFSVLGGQSEVVTAEVAKLVNERRHKQAIREAAKRTNGKKSTEFETMESDVEFGQRLAAVRLVGWRGITEAFSAAGALHLCQSNRDIAVQIVEQSDNVGNFIKL